MNYWRCKIIQCTYSDDLSLLNWIIMTIKSTDCDRTCNIELVYAPLSNATNAVSTIQKNSYDDIANERTRYETRKYTTSCASSRRTQARYLWMPVRLCEWHKIARKTSNAYNACNYLEREKKYLNIIMNIMLEPVCLERNGIHVQYTCDVWA